MWIQDYRNVQRKTIKVKIAISILALIAVVFHRYETSYQRERLEWSKVPCIQMCQAIDRYSKEFNIPKKYAYGIAFEETGFLGIKHRNYNPNQISSVGARGPMQVMPMTAKWMNGKIPTDSMLFDIDYNVKTSMKLLRHLKNVYGDWKTAFGAYNTGRPCVNQYALNVESFDYEKHIK